MSCSEKYPYMFWEGCILEEIVFVLLSQLNLSAADLVEDHSDHTGRMARIYQDRQQERRHYSTVAGRS